ncbi:NEDD8-specific protease 2 [Cyphellophora attinorum]|uniref:NEDD8-specific protease 2 n=1 Tax=Cyphellophora attinorum TaxID=1664694 RepID=A0A0N0NSI2_9EURO|nr:NEDD8-specific protease 2 [Phialophora attinorum]KPI46029.1 NEDD8-specific protease 2 [Phialophora attinorum]
MEEERANRLQKLAPDDAWLSCELRRAMYGPPLLQEQLYTTMIIDSMAVTKEDVNTLKNDWLTDNVICFWEEYLEREFLTAYKNSKIVLLRPSMSMMLSVTPDHAISTIKDVLPTFNGITHAFLPINDCTNPNQAEGGTHWSLLLVSIVDGVAFHYDSLPPGNEHEAANTTHKLSRLVNKPIRFIQLRDSPQQENSSDCGVFVCLNMRHLLLKRLLQVHTNEKVSMSLGGRRVDAREGRKEMFRTIEGFRKEGERRRSMSESPHPGRSSKSPPRIDSPIGSVPSSPRRKS